MTTEYAENQVYPKAKWNEWETLWITESEVNI